ncbi:lipopolysaccharide biosynthesis protein [Butyrivibrio sp. YAB3001]|uniref:lipopolysaccharide biosynthesis protein n=1 Tax=Butyrivibrio sp. YAB3001 TaxID=1520812 RepID=UPI0008F62628|nr:lipopolysaccharide biosynthesis protein [Butyrivibrio sp. YAB3001]SFC98458.1 Membrane protein involved in the export of O-antigen and teichoic acid [Butyrivibrio sp. YAB3001]
MSTKEKVLSNLIWRFAERIGAQAISFIVSIVLARILGPSEYGRVAMITVFTAILQVFVDGGFGNALIQKKDADDIDFSSVFYFNVLLCLVLYLIIFLCAPLIAELYCDDKLINLVKASGLIIVISGIKNVQQAYISRTLQFKRFFYATLIGTIVSAIMGILLACIGFGAWALVVQNLTNALVDTVVVWWIVKWRPKAVFSFSRLMSLFSYGWKLLLSNLIDVLYGNIRQLVIGKVYSPSDLAYYNRGRQIPNLVVTNVNTSIDSVLFPVLSMEQDNMEYEKRIAQKSIMISNYIMAPIMMGIAAAGETLIKIILTEKWISCVPFLRIFCILYMFQPVHTANINVIKALGRSDIRLKQEVITKGVGIILLVAAIPYGTLMIAYAYLIGNFFNQIVNSWPNKKLINYSYLEQLKDISISTLLAIFMGICLYGIAQINLPSIIILLIQTCVGAFIYIGGSIVLKIESFQYLLSMFNSRKFFQFK